MCTAVCTAECRGCLALPDLECRVRPCRRCWRSSRSDRPLSLLASLPRAPGPVRIVQRPRRSDRRIVRSGARPQRRSSSQSSPQEPFRSHRDPTMPTAKYLTKAQAARQLGVCTRTTDRLRRDGEFVWMRTRGGHVRIEAAAVDAYEARQKAAATRQATIPGLDEVRAEKAAALADKDERPIG